ncbi:MAG: sigma-70 family RNA polymerase sigma factor [Anaerolineae bacterium]|nr:sigma-70 family RNA polymerase sigma factor [Anaerolineae bacterium]
MKTELSTDEERDLITQLPENPAAFQRLYAHYFPRVFAYVAARVGREEDAEDIVAELFLTVVQQINRFEYRGEGSFTAWLFRIAYNAVQQFYRRERKRTHIPLEDLPHIQSRGLLPDEALESKERFARLRQMISSLSDRRREIITLRFFGELRNQEIAEVLGLSEKTVASHLCRGLEDLQRKYQREDAEA